jgi:hypothetical protein
MRASARPAWPQWRRGRADRHVSGVLAQARPRDGFTC